MQPKSVNPAGMNFVQPLSNKLVHPKAGTASPYLLKGAKVLSGKYRHYHGYYPYCWWYGSSWCWPCWCDFGYPLFPWMVDGSVALAPPPMAGPGGPVEEPLPAPMPLPAGAQNSPGGPSPAVAVQLERFLRVKNDTKEKVRFFALFHSKGPDGKDAWVPAEPGEPATVYSVEVEAGKSLDLSDDDGKPISADRVRIWAESPSRQWLDNETADLWLVPETDATGNHQYAAAEKQTHTFTVTD
jgi:hypothetical protein